MTRCMAVLCTVLITNVAVAAENRFRTLGWEDLVPKSTPLNSVITKLKHDQQLDVVTLVSIRNLKRETSLSEVSEDAEEAIEIRHRLKKLGLDPDKLMKAFDRMESDVKQREKMTVRSLDGKRIRIPGYALPLEHAGTGVTEMLLVPYVGACIHVPPPPANQTLYVKLAQTYKAKSLFDPVWITGRIKIRATNKSLSLIDGTAGVDTAYTVEDVTITPYKK